MHSPKLTIQLPTMEISGNFTHPLSSPLSDFSITGKLFRFRHTIPEIHTLELLTALIIFVTFHSLRQAKHRGLPVWPVIGMLPSLLFALRTNTYDWITGVLSRQGGTFTFTGPRFTNLKCVVTSDPRNLEHLLKTNFSNFPKGDYFQYILRDLLGDGIFNADDELWRRQRKTASIEFHSLAFRTLTVSSLNELVYDRLLPVLDSSTTTAIDLQDVLLRLTFDNVCMIAFGVDPGCLRLNSPEIPFAKAFEEVTECSVFRFVMPTALWKVMRFFNVGSEKNLRRALRRVDEFADEVIRSRKEELDCGVGRERKDLLTVFMRSKDEDGNGFSDKFLRDICVNFILAGRDTSSVALSWFFWLVGRNPAVEERILAEMCRILEEREDSGWRDGNIPVVFKAEEVKKMEYLQAALSEALRLYPSVPVDHKEVREDEVFPDGTVLKKGTKVIYAIYAMGRMESIWGKDCQEFKPERWLRDGKFMSESPYKFSAFNGGPRLCLGKDFAYYQMKFVAANIIFRYQVKVVKDFPVVPKLALTMYMKHGLMVNLCRRNLR